MSADPPAPDARVDPAPDARADPPTPDARVDPTPDARFDPAPEMDPFGVEGGTHAERLARGALLQQGAQVARLVGGFFVVTLLAHRLSFTELGTYTLLLSMITYVMFLKASVMNAVVLGVAETLGRPEPGRLDTIVSTAFAVYTAIGVLSGVVLCGVGLAVLPALHIPHQLYGDAQLGVVGLAAATLLSWPLQVFDDMLRGLQRFSAVGLLEILAMVVYVTGATALALTRAPVWTLVTLNASIPLLQGLACRLALRRLRVHVAVSRRLVDRAELKRMGGYSGWLVISGVADLATYSVDRFLLSALRSPALVGRYEGPLGAQNMIRYLNGVLNAPGIPITGTFLAAGDTARAREFVLRALRYGYAATIPFVVVMLVDAGPVLEAWLGNRFGSVAAPATLFTAWWIVGASTGMVGMVVTAGRHSRRLTAAAWVGAAVNLSLTIPLTILLGIYGPIIGAMTGYAVSLALLLPFSMRRAGISWSDATREAWLPSLLTGAGLALVLLAARYGLHLVSKPETVATLVLAPLAYWLVYAAVWLTPDERRLARNTLRPRAR